MNISCTSYELSIAGKHVAAWTIENRTLPPSKKFVMIPRDVLAKPELAEYSIRATVISRDRVAGNYAVSAEAIKLNLG